MSRSHKKPPAPAPAVVSTGCSGLMSCLSLHRRAPLTRGGDEEPAPPRPSTVDGGAAAEQYWKRVQFLEEEIRRLGKWLAQDQDEKSKSNTTNAIGCAAGTNLAKAACRDQESSSSDTATTTTKRCVNVGYGAATAGVVVQEMAKLEDGSYLHKIGQVGRPSERLTVQVSQPVVPADAASASEVLDKMAMTNAEDLSKFLAKMMPMKDIAGRQNGPGETVRRTARLTSGGDLLDAVLFNAMDRMEGLVLEGLKIQMSSTATDFTATATADPKRDEAVNKDRMVHVVLIQVRDPEEGYSTIGDPMIGLLEASTLGRKDGTVEVEVQGLHVAGISFTGRNRSDGRALTLMWSASLRECSGSCNGGGGDGDGGDGGCRCSYVRNPNRVFQR